jgi:UDP-N-acetylmuramoyl-tripeptide--D-alanyl-D-alanine ligase
MMISKADDLQITAEGTSFTCIERATGDFADFNLPQIGEHNVMNALAAIAVGKHFGIELKAMATALKNQPPVQVCAKRFCILAPIP